MIAHTEQLTDTLNEPAVINAMMMSNKGTSVNVAKSPPKEKKRESSVNEEHFYPEYIKIHFTHK